MSEQERPGCDRILLTAIRAGTVFRYRFVRLGRDAASTDDAAEAAELLRRLGVSNATPLIRQARELGSISIAVQR